MKHDLDYMLQVMQAAKEGKEIESYLYNYAGRKDWKTTNIPEWAWNDEDYRIKPEEPKPEYIPYETAEEFMKGQNEHGMYFTDKQRYNYYQPSSISSHKNNIGVCGEGYYLNFKSLLKDYIWQDGTPCGKLKKE